MSNSITPSWKELSEKTDEELRELLSELNNQSLRKLVRESVKIIADYKSHTQYQNEEIQLLYGKLNNIIALAEKKIR